MAIDLDSHFVPLEAANGADVGIRLSGSGGEVRYSAPRQEMGLERELFDLSLHARDMDRQRLDRRVLMIPPFCF